MFYNIYIDILTVMKKVQILKYFKVVQEQVCMFHRIMNTLYLLDIDRVKTNEINRNIPYNHDIH